MTAKIIKLGRPSNSDSRERAQLRSITFKVDEETAGMLEQLEREMVGAKIRGRTSIVLRQLIRDAILKK